VLLLYGLTIFLSAFLLFLIQPMFARMALPLLGGSPGVWNTALVFYQGALLAGYAFAHWSTSRLGSSRQRWLQLGLLAAALFALPIHVAQGWSPPSAGNPSGWLLLLLGASVGLPFFAVSTSSPVLQRWFAATGHPAARDPYFLYAASNAGSLSALLAYPVVVEPNLRLKDQAALWGVGFVLLIALFGACALFSKGSAKTAGNAEATASAEAQPISWNRRLRWLILAAIPASLMTGVTTYLSSDIAAIPLLWVIPLALYLLTFIFAFASRPYLPEKLMARAFPLLVTGLLVVVAVRASQPIALLVVLHLTVFFFAAAFCHVRLAADRPSTENLTQFYLWLSLGGVVGGAFNALLAPVIFNSVAEYPIALVLACMAAPPPEQDARLQFDIRKDALPPLLLGTMTAGLMLLGGAASLPTAVLIGLPALGCFLLSRRPFRFGLSLAAVLLASNLNVGDQGRPLHAERSFFGVHRVTLSPDGRFRQLAHGNTLHGKESLSDPGTPLTYFYPNGPIGDVFTGSRRFKRVGVVGLGAGSLAAYAHAGEDWTFYEIDPVVVRIAEDSQYFTFMRDCKAPYRIVLGDARLSLAAAQNGEYDLLVLDAYTSDSVPLHLMTREALQLYLQKLAPGGILAFHISNRHFDLEPVLGALAGAEGLTALVRHEVPAPRDLRAGKTASDWALLAREADDLQEWRRDARWAAPATHPGLKPWTDDFASPLPVFTWE
jgi:SAM-dependent methyltransferase